LGHRPISPSTNLAPVIRPRPGSAKCPLPNSSSIANSSPTAAPTRSTYRCGKSVIDLAHHYRRSAAAMGIGKAANIMALVSMGCDFGQGFLLGQPMAEERFIALLHRRSGPPGLAPFTRRSTSVRPGVAALKGEIV
jgi:hypothetical protein